jgi:hypothetical protein
MWAGRDEVRRGVEVRIAPDGCGIGLASKDVEHGVRLEIDVRMGDHVRRNPELEGAVFMWLGEPEDEDGRQGPPAGQ